MPKVSQIIYFTDNGSRITYRPGDFDEPPVISDDAMSVVIRLIDGEDLSDVAFSVT